MVYSEYEKLCKLFLNPKLAASKIKVGAISYNTLGHGVVGIGLNTGESAEFTEYLEALNWCLENKADSMINQDSQGALK